MLALPSGRLVRGRGLWSAASTELTSYAASTPDFGVYLLGREPDPKPWPCRWVRWPDFRLPRDPEDARAAIVEAWQRAADERVEVACGGGRGRTGTALACLAVLDGVPPEEAIGFVRRHYHHRAVETPAQRGFVRRFAPAS